MKNIVVLCSPRSRERFSGKGIFFPPLGLLLVAQALKNNGYRVKFYDGNYSRNYKKDILDYISCNSKEILFVGFYLALLQIGECIDIIKSVKSLDSDIAIVAGGPFPTGFSKIVIESGQVDICCTGDGAKIVKDIALCIKNKGNFYNIPNIVFKDGGKIVSNPRTERDVLNGDNKIFYENFLDIESYVNDFLLYLDREHDPFIKRAIPILTGLGCSYKCAFCENALLGHNHISSSAENIIDQVIYYHEKFNIDSFAFIDEDFFIDKPRLFKFLELLGKNGLKIKWGTQCRVNYFNRAYLNEDLLGELENAGCVKLAMGVESGSPRILKKINKCIAPEQAVSASSYGKHSSIHFDYSFMIKIPDETIEDSMMTFALMDKLLSIKSNSSITAIHHYIAYPNTPLSLEAENRLGFKIQDILSFEQFGNLSLPEYNQLVNPQKKDWRRESFLFWYSKIIMPFQFKMSLVAVYGDLFRVIALVRKKLKFYYFPVEVYLLNALKLVIKKAHAAKSFISGNSFGKINSPQLMYDYNKTK